MITFEDLNLNSQEQHPKWEMAMLHPGSLLRKMND